MTSSRVFATVFAATLFVSQGALADPSPKEQASQLDDAAKEVRKKNDVAGALALYEEARALDPTPERTCNVGLAHYNLDALAPAYFFLGECLSSADQLPAARVAEVSAAYAYVDRKLKSGPFAQVKFRATHDGVRVEVPKLGHGATFSLPRTVWLEAGEQSYQARADGYKPQSATIQVATNGKELQTVSISLTEIPLPVLPTPEHTTEPNAIISTNTRLSSTDAQTSSKRSAWIALATGTGLAVAGGVFHLRAVGVRSDLEELPSGESRRALIDDLRRERAIMAGFYGVGVVAIGVGTFLMLSGDESEPKSAPKIGLQIGTASIGIQGSY